MNQNVGNNKADSYMVMKSRNVDSMNLKTCFNPKKMTKCICNDINLKATDKILNSCFLPHHDSIRWKTIKESLEKFAKKPRLFIFEKTVMIYNNGKRDFTTMERFPKQSEEFNKELGNIATHALKLPELFKDDNHIRMLVKGKDSSLTLSEEQISCLLSNAFFCTFNEVPKSNYNKHHISREVKRFKKDSNNGNYKVTNYFMPINQVGTTSKLDVRDSDEDEVVSNVPSINFFGLFGKVKWGYYDDDEVKVKYQKLLCILQYFRTLFNRRDKYKKQRQVTFHRQVIKSPPDWPNSKNKLSDIGVFKRGLIEDAKHLLQVDFANKMVGGGVIGRGCVQEEIRFVICPELIISRLFTEELGDVECLIVTGIERFSNYSGYSKSFKFEGEYHDSTPLDDYGRRMTQVLVMDALKFSYEMEQFHEEPILREINKAYCGFKCDDEKDGFAIATGNWGCGAFKGNKELKFLIQLMAASQASRELCYFTFDDDHIVDRIKETYDKLLKYNINTGDLYRIIMEAVKPGRIRKNDSIRFFDYLDIRERSPQHQKMEISDNEDEEETEKKRGQDVSPKNEFLGEGWHS